MSQIEIGGHYLVRKMPDDSELLRRFISSRSDLAFTSLVERHIGMVYHAALRRTRQPQLAEDATQLVFITLARKADGLTHHSSLVGWLHATTRFAANRVLRGERRRLLREQEAFLMESTQSSAGPDPDRLRLYLDDVMDHLSERDRELVLLRYFEGRSFSDLARILGLTDAATRKRTERAIEKMRLLFGKKGVTSSASALAAILSAEVGLAAPVGLSSTVAASALAVGGAATGYGLFGAVGVMSSSKATFAMVGLVALVAIGTSTYYGISARQIESQIAVESRQMDLQTTELRALLGRTEADERAAAALRQLMVSGSASDKSTKWDPKAAGRQFLTDHPEARAILLDALKASTTGQWESFLQSLPPGKAERVRDYLMARQSLILNTPAGTLTLSPDDHIEPAEFTALMQQELGPDDYQRFLVRDQAITMNGQVIKTIATDSYIAGTPLSNDQSERLGEILNQNTSGRGASANTDWDSVLEQARGILAPAQLTSLQVVVANSAYQTALATALASQSGGGLAR